MGIHVSLRALNLVLFMMWISAIRADGACNWETELYTLCSSDAMCRLRMDIDNTDYTTFKHVVRVYIINPNVQNTPGLQAVPVNITETLHNGTLCEDYRYKIMWLLLMRQTSICADHEYFDVQKGACVCMDGKACKDLDGPERESVKWIGVILFGVIGLLLYYLLVEVKMRQYMSVLLDELSLRNKKLRDIVSGGQLPETITKTPNFDTFDADFSRLRFIT